MRPWLLYPPRMHTRLRTALASVLIAVLCGCAAGPVVSDPYATVPPDFSLDLVVLASTVEVSPVDPEQRSGRFLVWVDGSLRWAPVPRGLPPWRRTLERREMAALWSLVKQLGMDGPDGADPPTNHKLIEQAPDETIYLLMITADGDVWGYVRRIDAGETPDPAMVQLVRHLATLAWADSPPPAAAVPRRYDFGPDPYERYRR